MITREFERIQPTDVALYSYMQDPGLAVDFTMPDFGLDFSSKGPFVVPFVKTLSYDEKWMPSVLETSYDGKPLVRETYVWEFESSNRREVVSRTRRVEWFQVNGELHPSQKLAKKSYPLDDLDLTNPESIRRTIMQREARRKPLIDRRRRVVSALKSLILTALIPKLGYESSIQLGGAFLITNDALLRLYIEDDSDLFKSSVVSASDYWLDFEYSNGVTIRDLVLNSLVWP